MKRRETCGVREPSGNAPAIAGGIARRCWYHRTSVPVEAQGKPFFKAGMAPSPDAFRKSDNVKKGTKKL